MSAGSIVSQEALLRTYNPKGYADPTEQLHDYQRVQRYIGQNPNAGRNKIGNALELPPERVRGWMNDTKPDSVRGVETARDYGWLDLEPDTRRGRAFAELFIGIYACGGISARTKVPGWTTASSESDQRLWTALDRLGGDPTHRHAEASGRPPELTLSNSASVFGRCLIAAGAPVSDKNADSVGPLPSWLLNAGTETRRRAAELYLLERSTTYPDKATVTFQMNNRTHAYKTSLARLFRSLTDEKITVGQNVTVSAAAARDLGFGRDDSLRERADTRT